MRQIARVARISHGDGGVALEHGGVVRIVVHDGAHAPLEEALGHMQQLFQRELLRDAVDNRVVDRIAPVRVERAMVARARFLARVAPVHANTDGIAVGQRDIAPVATFRGDYVVPQNAPFELQVERCAERACRAGVYARMAVRRADAVGRGLVVFQLHIDHVPIQQDERAYAVDVREVVAPERDVPGIIEST